MMETAEYVVIAAIVAILGVSGMVLYMDSQRPTFSLKKEHWTCASSHRESSTTFTNVGSGTNITLIPITTWTTVCDQWNRK